MFSFFISSICRTGLLQPHDAFADVALDEPVPVLHRVPVGQTHQVSTMASRLPAIQSTVQDTRTFQTRCKSAHQSEGLPARPRGELRPGVPLVKVAARFDLRRARHRAVFDLLVALGALLLRARHLNPRAEQECLGRGNPCNVRRELQ